MGLWFIQLQPDLDWLASLYTTKEGELKGTYRFRYYVDDKTFDSEDKKSWWTMTSTASVAETIEKFRGLYEKMWKLSKGDHYEILMDEEGIDSFMKKFEQVPFYNGIELSANEAKWMGYAPMEDKDGT